MTFLLSIIILTQFTIPYDRRVFVDAEGEFVIYTRYFQGTLVSIDTVKTISDFLSLGLYARNRDLLFKELKQDMVQSGGYGNKGLFGTFEIPLPKGGFGDFMGETGKLDVGGHVKITLGGSETFVSNVPGAMQPSLWPELEMNQEMVINLDGQVGDRVRVFIDHNSERINETQNRITVTYQGREDEIIQEIEGGDTELRIPATTYTGDIPSHRGLFGIKSKARFGPLDIVAIASNEQTSHQEIDIEGIVQAQADSVWSREYHKRRFFWLGTHDLIDQQSLEIYIDDNNYQNNITSGWTWFGVAYADTNGDDIIPDDTLQSEEGYFTLHYLHDDYVFLPGMNIIELTYGLQKNVEVLGVKYDVVDSLGNVIRSVGSFDHDTLLLKLICPKSPDTLSATWNLELKNYYQVVAPGTRLDSLRIFYITTGGQHMDRTNAGDTYLEVLRLDQNSDGLVDDYSLGGYGFDPGRGLIIFPDALPFASDTLDDPDYEIYRNPYYMQGRGKYYLYKKTIEARPVFDLPPNVVDVKVYVDGVEQTEGIDYYVNFDEMRLEFKKILPPTARVKIHAEYAPFFSAAQKSLIGMRATLRPLGDVVLGSSFFYRTESYPTDRVRLREEPFNRVVLEGDFAVPQSLPFLTKVVDWLPLVETEAESKLNVNFEGALSFSNLNSEGEVFLDDLESATIVTNMVPIMWIDWGLSSQPVGLDINNFASERIVWYNPRGDERLQADDIYIDPLDPNEIADVLKVVFTPDNMSSFAGLIQYIYSENFEDCENLELIINGTGGRIHIDLAQEMREDQLRRNMNYELVGFNTLEDEDIDRNGTWNESTEDTGLDGVFGTDGDNVPGDDGNDDFDENDLAGGINGTERNRLWSTEDIDRNGILNSDNIYYSYSISLDADSFLVADAGLQPGWKMFRIPIKDSLAQDTVFGQPDWRRIKYVRIWLDGFAQAETLLIYRFYAAGSRWKNLGIKGDLSTSDPSETFTVTPVNTKTHSYYVSPYGTEYDPLTGQIKSEGALELLLENIKGGHTCVTRRNTDANEDYRAYDTLTFYLNARQSNPLISFRIGRDSLNYYEYRTEYNNGAMIAAGHGWRLFTVSLRRFLDLKQETQGQGSNSDSFYTVVGNPSLSINQFFELTITNQNPTALSDTIWFNDIKLIAPQTEIGRIIRANSSLNFADLATVNFSFDESNGRFKRLSESKEISISSAGRNYVVNTNIALHKLFFNRWGFNIPLGISYRNSEQRPRFAYFANDLELTGAELERQKSTNVMNSYAISISKAGSRLWILKHTLDRLTFDHTRSTSAARAVLDSNTTRQATYRVAYGLDPKVAFKILGQTFSVLPQNISCNVLYADNLVRSYYRINADSVYRYSASGSQNRQTLNPGFSIQYAPHRTVSTNYEFSQSRDSVRTRGRFGEEVGRNQSFNATLSEDLKIVQPRFSFNSSYTEDYRFEIRREENVRNVSNNARYGIDATLNIQGIVRFFTQLRDEKKDSLASVGSPSWLARQIEEFVLKLQNPSFAFSRLRNSNYLNVTERPELRYQFGLDDSISSDLVSPGSFPGRGSADSYGITSGLDLRFLSLQGAYNATTNRTFVFGNIETRVQGISYPNANIRLLRLEALPFLKGLAHSSSITSAFNQSVERRYQVGDSLVLQSDTKNISFSPLVSWQTNWVRGISSTVDVTYSETVTNDFQGLIALTSKSLTRGGSINLAYTFSAPRGISLPLLKGVRFASSLAMNLGVSYNRSTNYSGYAGDLNTPIYDSSVLSGDLGMSYNFSASITGGANFSYSQNNERVRNQDTKRVGLNIWTNINF